MAHDTGLSGAKVAQGGPKYLQGGSCPPTFRAYVFITLFLMQESCSETIFKVYWLVFLDEGVEPKSRDCKVTALITVPQETSYQLSTFFINKFGLNNFLYLKRGCMLKAYYYFFFKQ